jgi:hypothetical protein
MNKIKPVVYGQGGEVVQIGDIVNVRIFLFIKRKGRVVYIPGISPLNCEMEHDGVRLVGVNFSDGGSGGFWVDPTNATLTKTVTFLARDTSPAGELPSETEWK